MLSLKWSTINTQEFMGAIVTLNNAPRLEAKTAYRVGRIFEACKVAMDEYRKKEKVLVETKLYFVTNEDGTMKTDKDGTPAIKPECNDAFSKESGEIANTNQTDVKVCKLEFQHVSGVGLPPKCLMALEKAGLLEGCPDEDSGEIQHKAVG